MPLAQVLEERNGAGSVTAEYVLALDRLVSQERGGNTYLHLADGQHSTRALVDGTGALSDTYTYDAFGNQTASTGTTQNPYRYAGQQLDPATGLYSMRARYYAPDTGRFTTPDPMAGPLTDPLSRTSYPYSRNDPVNLYDPTGQFFASFSGVMMGAFARFAFWASPALYMLNHLVMRLGQTSIALAIRSGVLSFTSGVYRLAGMSPRLLNLHAGQVFEKLVNPAMRLLGARYQVPIQNGRAVVDWIWNGVLVDTKLGGYFSRGQFLHYIAEAQRQSGIITYITLRAPNPATVQSMIAEAAQSNVVVRFITIFPF
jgi:RHS repeat-associated protein